MNKEDDTNCNQAENSEDTKPENRIQAVIEEQGLAKTLWQLFVATFTLSAFTFGGGYVIITLMKRKFVDEYHWIDEQEMLDITALAQAAPGVIAVNASILVGARVAKIPGMLVAILGTVLPPLIILTIVSYFYTAFAANRIVALLLAGMQAGVAAVICHVVLTMAWNVIETKSAFSILMMILALIAVLVFHVNVVYCILGAILTGTIMYFIKKGQKKI